MDADTTTVAKPAAHMRQPVLMAEVLAVQYTMTMVIICMAKNGVRFMSLHFLYLLFLRNDSAATSPQLARASSFSAAVHHSTTAIVDLTRASILSYIKHHC